MNFFEKIIFAVKKNCVVLFDEGLVFEKFAYFIFPEKQIFFHFLKNIEDVKIANFLIRFSKRPIIIINKNTKPSDKILENIPPKAILILNSDFFFSYYDPRPEKTGESFKRDLDIYLEKKKEQGKLFTFGLRKDVDFNVSDINLDPGGINFKINYKGNNVPFWIKGSFKKVDVSIISGVIAFGAIMGMNLVEISQKLKQA